MSDVKKISTNIQTNFNLIKNSPNYKSNHENSVLTPTMKNALGLINFEEEVIEYNTKIMDIEQL